MTHPRVTPQGQAMGRNTAHMASMGERLLKDQGLAAMNLPMLRDDMCKSCAAKSGTVPNGCIQTQLDLLKAAAEGTPFLCHSPHDGRMCAGWVRVRAQLVATPLPDAVMDLLAKHEFSPPDEPDAP